MKKGDSIMLQEPPEFPSNKIPLLYYEQRPIMEFCNQFSSMNLTNKTKVINMEIKLYMILSCNFLRWLK